MLPGTDGFEICKKIREGKKIHQFLWFQPKKDDIDKIRGLGLGADDYITKPFGTSELLARIRASLRHSNRLYTDSSLYIRPYQCGSMLLDFSKRILTIDGKAVHLTPIEYKIVAYLAQNSGKVITYASILSNVWGPYADSDNKNPARKHGKYPQKNRKRSRAAAVYLYGSRGWVPHERRRI